MPRTSHVELPGCPQFRALCCDNLGLIKVVEVPTDKGAPQVVNRWGPPDPQRATLCTSFSHDISPGFAVARKNGKVEVLDPGSGALQLELGVPTIADTSSEASKGEREDASNSVCGMHLFKETSPWAKSLLTCTEKGVAAIQRVSISNGQDGVSAACKADADPVVAKWNVSESGCVLCLQVDGSERHTAFGGKGVEVNLWDMEKGSKLWTAKSPRRDNLGLIAPPYVTALTFLSNQDSHKLVVGTGHHQVRLYDVGAQRRPIMVFDYGESPIKTLAADANGYTVYVGTGHGDLACFDVRTGQNLGGFKGKVAGSIRSIVRHPDLPIIASCGLDRYLRIHHSQTRQLLASVFLKQQLVSVVFDTSTVPQAPKTETTPSTVAPDKLQQGVMDEPDDSGGIRHKGIEKGAESKSHKSKVKKTDTEGSSSKKARHSRSNGP